MMMTHRIARLGMVAIALLVAALVGACEVAYLVTGRPVKCTPAVDTIRIGADADTTVVIDGPRCQEDDDAR